jgi:hypothetical protein
MIDDGESGAVENVKDEQYSAMPKSWQARNNMEMNKGMKYNDMADMANTAHPVTPIKMDRVNKQLGPKAEDNDYNYNDDRS